jgi:translocator protein
MQKHSTDGVTSTPRPEDRRHERLGLAAFVAACLFVAGIGGAITGLTVNDWYQELAKPPFNPPSWVFAPVWTALYVLMAVAAWRVWLQADSAARRPALTVFAVQLCLNLLWSCLFFGLTSPGAALVEICALWAAIVVTIVRFKSVDVLAAWFLVPYLAWVSFAALLNGSIWWLN